MRKYLWLFFLPLLAACGAESGYVTALDYVPMRSHVVTQCAAYNTQGMCTVYVPVTHTYPECYRVEFRDDEGRYGSDCVSPGQFESITIGQWYE